jgi:hypothetical protein
MEKETLIKLLLLCGVGNPTLKYCTHLGVTMDDIQKMRYRILAEQDGRMELI